MLQLKAGYVIDELFHEILKSNENLDFENLNNEFSNLCYFSIEGLNEKTDIEDIFQNKILLVAYNIITRGSPTRASLNLSKELLKSKSIKLRLKIKGQEENK